MIHYYNVSVIVPTTSIVGGSEYHVDKGSAIQLTCVIKNVSDRVTTFESRGFSINILLFDLLLT